MTDEELDQQEHEQRLMVENNQGQPVRCPRCGSSDFYTKEIKVYKKPLRRLYECKTCHKFWESE